MRISDWSSDVCSSDLQQIQDSRRHQVGQRELFLVINRLEEFAAAVHDRLGTVDFVTKREIIRGLVKRVEIHKDEILVVFRVDPDPGFNASETSTGSGTREKSMQDRTRRNLAQLGESRSEEHTSELQSLMRISYAVFCL